MISQVRRSWRELQEGLAWNESFFAPSGQALVLVIGVRQLKGYP